MPANLKLILMGQIYSNAKAESKAKLSQLAASSASPTTSSSQPHCQLSLAVSWQHVKHWDIKSSIHVSAYIRFLIRFQPDS